MVATPRMKYFRRGRSKSLPRRKKYDSSFFYLPTYFILSLSSLPIYFPSSAFSLVLSSMQREKSFSHRKRLLKRKECLSFYYFIFCGIGINASTRTIWLWHSSLLPDFHRVFSCLKKNGWRKQVTFCVNTNNPSP